MLRYEFKVDDTVAIYGRTLQKDGFLRGTVTAIKKRHIVVRTKDGTENSYQPDGSNAYPKWNGYEHPRLEPWTDKHTATHRELVRRRYIQTYRLDLLTSEQVDQVHTLLKSFETTKETPHEENVQEGR